MPHFPNFGGTRLSVQPEKDSFGSFEPREVESVRGGDSLTGEGRPTKIWTNGGASTFEDRLTLDFDSNDVVTCNGIDADIQRPTHPNDLSGTSGPGGSTYTNGTSKEGSYFMTETFEPAAGMDFAGSLNPVLEVGTTSGPGGTTFMTGQFDMPTDNVGGTSGPGGTSY